MENKQDTVLDIKESHSVSDQLQFQDIAHDDSGEIPGAKVQTHNFTNFPDPDESDDDSQQANLIKGEKKQASFWTFEYYQNYFDVDTHQVLRRILGSVVPNPRTNFLQHHIRPNPDLYGPFWICITLVFTTAIAGNMANYFQMSGQNYQWAYDFHKVTFAATAIFGYWWVVPTLLYAVLWWRGSQAGYLYSEILCVYGYSLAIYIPISILWVIQIHWLQWLLVMVGMALSGSVLVVTFWPAVKADDKKISLVTMAFIVIFHGLLAVGFVLYFFHVPARIPALPPQPVNATTPGTLQSAGQHADTTDSAMKPPVGPQNLNPSPSPQNQNPSAGLNPQQPGQRPTGPPAAAQHSDDHVQSSSQQANSPMQPGSAPETQPGTAAEQPRPPIGQYGQQGPPKEQDAQSGTQSEQQGSQGVPPPAFKLDDKPGPALAPAGPPAIPGDPPTQAVMPPQ